MIAPGDNPSASSGSRRAAGQPVLPAPEAAVFDDGLARSEEATVLDLSGPILPSPVSMADMSLPGSIDEQARRSFETAWRDGRPEPIDRFLPPEGHRHYLATLLELALIELEFRLKGGEAARVEAYLARYPVLGQERRAVLALLAAEYELRQRREPALTLDDYARRFPQYRGELRGRRPPLAYPVALAEEARFRVLRPHARGGIGQVSLAQDRELDREVALKEIQPRFAGQPQFRGRFLQEARITGRLEHPGIVPVYGMGQGPDGQPYYAMRFIKGQSLNEAIRHFHASQKGKRNPGPHLLELRQLLNRFVAVCNTMAYAHSKGVLHRDLKPDNIMLGPYGETLVVDWGLAKVLGQPEDASLLVDPATPGSGVIQTEMGALVGTPPYMSPEQARGQLDRLGPASDVYSLGATLYKLLTGKLPFETPNLGSLLERVCSGRCTPPRQVDRRVPPALDAITRKAMALKPEDRYASAKDLADDVERFLAHEPVGARSESWGEKLARLRRRYRGVTRAIAVATAVIIVVLTGALVLVSGARDRENRQHSINTLSRDLADGWQVVDWTPEHLDYMDQRARLLAGYDAEAAKQAQDRTNKVCALAMKQALDARVLDPGRHTLTLRRLEARGYDGVQELRDDLQRRVAAWETVFKLAPPFGNLAEVLDRHQVRGDGQALFAQKPSSDDSRPLVRTRVPSAGNVQLEATFAPSWSSVPVLGLLLNADKGQGYRFLVSVAPYRTGRHDHQLFRLATLASFQDQGFPVKISMIRNDVLLREQPVSLPPGQLRLVARRDGGRLSFQVNQQPELVFDDPFPLPAKSGTFGVYWPADAGLVQLEAAHQALPPKPSPLEQGDELFARLDYTGAQEFYKQQAAQAGARPVAQEARYKQALALLELGRKPQAQRLWRELMDELPTRRGSAKTGASGAAGRERLQQTLAFLERGQHQQARQQLRDLLAEQTEAQAYDTHRWPLLAACQLWRLAVEPQDGDPALADQVLERLHVVFSFEKLVALIPAEVRKPILDKFRLRGPRWRSPLVAARGDMEKLKKAIQIEELIDESAYERRMTRWRLSDQYRMENDLASALLEVNQLLKEDPPLDEQLAFVRDSVWILIEERKAGEALPRVNAMLETLATNPVVLPLLVERARIHAAQEKWDEAERDVEDFFKQAGDGQRQHYADWGEACLLRGFLRQRRGDEPGAQDAWRKGLFRHFPGGPPTPPRGRLLYGVADDRVNITLRCFSQLASLTGEMTDADANYIFNAAAATTGVSDKVAIDLGKSAFSPAFLRAVLLNMYRSDRGKDLARRMTLRQISFKACSWEMTQLILAEVLRRSSYPDGLVPEGLEPLTWQGAGRVLEYYNEGKIDTDVALNLLKLWKGKDNPLGTWERVAPKLEPDLRVPGAFALGRHFLVQGQEKVALALLREVVERGQPDNPFHRLARAELDKHKAKERN